MLLGEIPMYEFFASVYDALCHPWGTKECKGLKGPPLRIKRDVGNLPHAKGLGTDAWGPVPP